MPLAEFAQLKDVAKNGPVTVYARATVPNYAAATASATVTIRPRPVTLVAGNADKAYDQTPLVCGEWLVKDDGTVVDYGFIGEEGIASLKMTSDSVQTQVGSHANTIDATSIVAKSGTDLSNYAVTYEPGLLTVAAGAGVNVTATDYEGVYDGRWHVVDVSVTKPTGSGEAEVSYSLSPEGPFVSLAEFVQVKNVTKNGPVTVYVQVSVPNYESVRANATVTITPCPVILRAGSGEKSFDRTPLSVSDYEALGFVDGEGVADLKMVADSTITLPGTRINVIDESSVTFADGTDEDNYDITYQRGELKVLPGMGVGGVDTFEENQEGATADSIENWQGEDASIVLENYDAPTPPGHVTTLATHTRVLDVTDGEAIRIVPEDFEEKEKMDVMVCVQRSAVALRPLPDDVQLRVAADEEGRLCLWHLYEEDGEWKKGWVPLSEKAYANGEWVRIGIELDYTGNPSGDAFAKVTVNGSCQPTAHGVRSPTDTRAYGPWHYLAKNRRTGGVALPREISFSDTKVDDLMLCKQMVVPEHEGPTSVDGIDFSWFDNAGLPRNPLAAAPFVSGYTLGDIYTAGLDPYTERPLMVTDFCLDASGRPHVEFNGYKGETPVGYQMLYSTTPDFRSPVVLQPADGNFDGDAATWSTMWNGKVPSGDSGAGFYRVKAVR